MEALEPRWVLSCESGCEPLALDFPADGQLTLSGHFDAGERRLVVSFEAHASEKFVFMPTYLGPESDWVLRVLDESGQLLAVDAEPGALKRWTAAADASVVAELTYAGDAGAGDYLMEVSRVDDDFADWRDSATTVPTGVWFDVRYDGTYDVDWGRFATTDGTTYRIRTDGRQKQHDLYIGDSPHSWRRTDAFTAHWEHWVQLTLSPGRYRIDAYHDTDNDHGAGVVVDGPGEFSGVVQPSPDIDRVTFHAPPGIYEFTVDDARVRLWGASSVAESVDDQTLIVDTRGTDDGSAGVEVGSSADEPVAYTVHVRAIDEPPGESTSTAIPIAAGTTKLTGRLNPYHDQTWYAFEAEPGRLHRFTATVTGANEYARLNVGVRAADGTRLSAASAAGVQWAATAAGTYYLVLDGERGLNYEVDVEQTQFELPAPPTPMPPEGTQLPAPVDGVRVLSIEAAGGEEVYAFGWPSYGLTYRLLSPEGTLLDEGPEISSLVLPRRAGMYYLVIEGGEPSLRLDWALVPDDDDDAFETARVLTPGVPLRGRVGFWDDRDYVRFHAEAGVFYQLDSDNSLGWSLYDADLNPLTGWGFPSWGDPWLAPATGDYYLSAGISMIGGHRGDYTITMQPLAPDPLAPVLARTDTIPARPTGSSSWHRLPVNAGDTVVIDQPWPTGANILVLTDDGRTLSRDYSDATWHAIRDETVWVHVEYEREVDLAVSVYADPEDSADNGQVPIEVGQTLTGTIGDARDRDVFELDRSEEERRVRVVVRGAALELTASQPNAFQVDCANPVGNDVAGVACAPGETVWVGVLTPDGREQFTVSGPAGAAYSITLEELPAPTLTPGQPVVDLIDVAGDIDRYTLTVTEAGFYEVSVSGGDGSAYLLRDEWRRVERYRFYAPGPGTYPVIVGAKGDGPLTYELQARPFKNGLDADVSIYVERLPPPPDEEEPVEEPIDPDEPEEPTDEEPVGEEPAIDDDEELDPDAGEDWIDAEDEGWWDEEWSGDWWDDETWSDDEWEWDDAEEYEL